MSSSHAGSRPMTSDTGRLIALTAHGPAENMSIDQALLESTGRSGIPALRFYRWSQPALSLGYFQRLDDRVLHPDSESLACVRRATGGGAIVHHHELTYSVAMPVGKAEAGPRLELYRQIHQAIIDVLADLGVRAVPFRLTGVESPPISDRKFLCFQRRTDEDLVVSGYKVLGSAQRKTRDAVLQHGSLLLQASRFAPQLPGVIDLGARPIAAEQVANGLVNRLGTRLGLTWRDDELSEEEQERASKIRSERFAAQVWMARH
ncbi:MAG: lipoate--protein ligase family protein [Rubripirellula sp.]